jgi:3',5'-cyclic AMP phosphodiesterase CpdA
LLSRYPNGPELDIDGLILDYIGRSGEKLDAVFKLNPSLYPYLFAEDPEKGLRLLQVVGDPDIVLRCGKRYPLIAKVLASRGAELCAPALLKNPSASLGYKVRSVVWHISDAHFGKFYKLKETPRELAFLVAQLARDYPDLLPDVILISGDVSSIASQLEFEQFRSFCRDISAALWKQACPERILVVPGNHDVTWESDGRADRLSRFSQNFRDDSVCVTPFGEPERVMGGGRFKVIRKNPHPETAPPVAVVFDLEKDINFALLVSGYFSGNVPAEVRGALDSAAGTAEDLATLLRVDEGEVSHEYLHTISEALQENRSLCLGLIHHNPVPYGIEMTRNPLAPTLMETLWINKVPVLLHGHIHLNESRSNKRPPIPGQSYPIPVSTLTSVTSAGGARGMNIYFIGPGGEDQRLDAVVWTISQSMSFRLDDATWRYRVRVKSDACEVAHL